jgi:hypothetical protein
MTQPGPSGASRGNEFIWNEDRYAAENYDDLGKLLSAGGDLYRNADLGEGLLQVLPDGIPRPINKATDLAPLIADRLRIRRKKKGDDKGDSIPVAHLNAALRAECFLHHFTAVDQVTSTPLYLPDFSLCKPGYNDGGSGYRVRYVGTVADVADGMATIKAFLDVMEFETDADRTNVIAAALTVMLCNHWPGGKPIIVVTSTKSHGGKETTIVFITGTGKSVSISYQATNWAFERSFVGAINSNREANVLVVENVRLDRNDIVIASAFLERYATDPKPFLFSTGTGDPIRIRNDIVVAVSTNSGKLSEDIMNRGLPIHLHPIGDVADRRPAIGNPKHDFLPAHRDRIAAELRGMIERWKAAGQPLDEEVQHPFTQWAKVIGGILKVNGITGFLANYGIRKTSDDPIRQALGLLGAYEFPRKDGKCEGEWLRAGEWVELVGSLGLVRTLIPERDRENGDSQARAMGIVLSAHEQETFTAESESHRLTLQLQKVRRRRKGEEAKVCYRFVLRGMELLSAEDAPEAAVADGTSPATTAADSQRARSQS